MYCDKLINIVQDEKSAYYHIDNFVIKKLDKFIKEKTTLWEKRNLNPMKFSIEMSVQQDTALMVFILGIKTGLFKSRIYYNCICDEHFEISSPEEQLNCPLCERSITPSLDRGRVYLYFKLLENPVSCSWDQEQSLYPLDFLEEGYAENFTMADLDKITEEGEYDNLIGLRTNRESEMQEYLQGDSTSEFD